jgi:hypothetical protein
MIALRSRATVRAPTEYLPGRFLLKRVQHVDGLGKPGDVQHAPFSQHVHADLADAGANLFHGLPIRWFQPTLHETQFEPGRAPSLRRERLEIIEARPDKPDRLHVRHYIRLLI